MSRANAWVRFRDGTIKYGIYNGTIDHYWCLLFDSLSEAWELWNDYYRAEDDGSIKPKIEILESHPIKIIEPVVLANDYGGATFHAGYATKYLLITTECNHLYELEYLDCDTHGESEKDILNTLSNYRDW